MRSLLVAAMLLSSTLVAQSLTTSYAATYYLASIDGAVYFDLVVPQTLQLDALDVDLHSPAGATGAIDVYVRPGTWLDHSSARGDWTLVAQGNVTSAGPTLPTPCTLSRPVGLPPGTYGVALHHRGVMPSYLFAFGLRTYANQDLQLSAGGSSMLAFGGQQFFSRVFSGTLHYTLGGGPFAMATVEEHGEGCHRSASSFYEAFPPAALDLANTRLVLTQNNSGGYDVQRSQCGAIVLPANAQNLGLARGGHTTVSLASALPYPGGSSSELLVLPDGRVYLDSEGLLGSSTMVPSVAALLAGPATIAVDWQDFAPAGADNVYRSSDPVSGAVTITWWRLPTYGDPSGVRNTFALTVHPSGVLVVECDGVSNTTGPCLVGWSQGGNARDGGGTDLSATNAFATRTDDYGLCLRALGRPALATSTTLQATGVAANAFAMALLALQPLVPGLDLGAFGGPGCSLLVDPSNVTMAAFGAGCALDFNVPASPILLGATMQAQALDFGAALRSSNALALTVGSV